MTNAKLLILFFDTYRMYCDAESNGNEDASTFITESYDSVRKYVLDCINSDTEMTAKGIIKTVTESIYDDMSMDDTVQSDECINAISKFISALMKNFNSNYYV